MQSRFLLILALVVGLAVPNAGAFDLDDVAVFHSVGNGELSVFDKDLSSGTKIAFQTGLGLGASTSGFLDVQSDNKMIALFDLGFTGNNAIFTQRDPNNPTGPGELPGSADGMGRPTGSLVVFNNGAGYEDYVFLGSGNGLSSQVRRPTLTDGIADVGTDGLNGGPGNFGDGRVGPAVMQSDGDLIWTYELSTQPLGSRGRIRRQAGGDLAANTGPDEGLGISAGNDIYGLHLDVLSNDNLVLAKDDRVVEIRHGTSLSPDLGGFTVTAGPFGADISGIGVLSDDRVVLVTAAGELALRDTDLTPLDSQGLFGAPLGTHEITAVAVASDDDVIVGTAAGDLFRFAYNSGPGTLVQQGSPLTGLGRVLDIDFMNATGGGWWNAWRL